MKGLSSSMEDMLNSLQHLPRLQGRVYVSALDLWCSSPVASAFYRSGHIFRLIAEAESFNSGYASTNIESDVPAWLSDMHSRLCHVANIEEEDCRIVTFEFRAQTYMGLAYRTSLTLCYEMHPKTNGMQGAMQIKFGLLPQLLREHGWRFVQHVFRDDSPFFQISCARGNLLTNH